VTLPPFQALLDDHAVAIHRFLVGLVGPLDAEDCFQETFLAALRAYPRVRPGSNLRAWLFTVARNKAMDAHRRRRREPVPVGDAPHEGNEGGDGAASEFADGELWSAVAGLPEKQRAAVVLRFTCDLSHREIGRVLDCSDQAARRNVHEGVKRLREVWA
jgi:RNA polymerase sigma factor (sigma-70 family)